MIVFVDYFSKCVEVSAVWSATAQVAASKFLAEIFARHGTPTYLISDEKSEKCAHFSTPFVSKLFEHVIAALGTEHRLTMAYHPQTNATKRVNRTLKTVIRAYVGTSTLCGTSIFHKSVSLFLLHPMRALVTLQQCYYMAMSLRHRLIW